MPLIKDATGSGAVERLCDLALEIASVLNEYPSHSIMPRRDDDAPAMWRGGTASELLSCVKLIRKKAGK